MKNMDKKDLIVIVGPTAVGKTATSISLAKKVNGEIISGDSMQVYKGMDIGTAKVLPHEQDGIPHHLINIKNPEDSFSVQEFQRLATSCIQEIHNRGKVPIIVGGTGLYVSAVIYGYEFSEVKEDTSFRSRMETFVEKHGAHELHAMLKENDRKSYEAIHPNNVRRVIRALEVYERTGIPFSEQGTVKKESPYNVTLIGLTMERQKLYDRIDRRVDVMLDQGLIDEVKGLYKQGIKDCQSVLAIGYKELYDYLEGHASLEEAIVQLKQNSRRYAKRQLTWFRNKMDITWFDVTDHVEQKVQEIHEFVEGKLY
ncbi:tRNA (adenosine(37)-N6)-dimethylallyltransferase MiaA [Alteribacter aurantiacus]|uniref:tRNA (adenosine(37)-N6)-dimethylallyltransferase MiaA n=1 Tax=Alteribacter aurantiacus TaxID=254410 RepID=UPI0012EB186F|nr:tRNA (adenosine(37)-N6)-dimethylallyltransferase MiaA [Alteribacter aurantiacus]